MPSSIISVIDNLSSKTGVMHMAGCMHRKRQRRTRPAMNKLEYLYIHSRVRLQYFLPPKI